MQTLSVINIAQSALHFIAWQTCSIEHSPGSSEKHPAMQQLMREDYAYIRIHNFLFPCTLSHSWVNGSNVQCK